MKRALLVFTAIFSQSLYASSTDLVGKWRTIDDDTKKPKSIVEISRAGDVFEGRVVQIFKAPGEDQNPKCTKCEGSLKDQPVIGLKILSDLKQRKSDWGDGKIVDPKNGKTYDVKMELAENGAKLKVRGFIGFSLLGRTQTWERVE